VVHDQQLEIGERLTQHGIDRHVQILLDVERRHDDADGRRHERSTAGSADVSRRSASRRMTATGPETTAGMRSLSGDAGTVRGAGAIASMPTASYSAATQRAVALPGSWNRSAATARRVVERAAGSASARSTAATVSATPRVDSDASASRLT